MPKKVAAFAREHLQVRDGVLVLPPTAAEGPAPRSWIEALEALAAAHVDGLRRVLALDGGGTALLDV